MQVWLKIAVNVAIRIRGYIGNKYINSVSYNFTLFQISLSFCFVNGNVFSPGIVTDVWGLKILQISYLKERLETL